MVLPALEGGGYSYMISRDDPLHALFDGIHPPFQARYPLATSTPRLIHQAASPDPWTPHAAWRMAHACCRLQPAYTGNRSFATNA